MFKANGSVLTSGRLVVSEQLPMNLEYEISIIRCNVDSTGCAFYHKFIFPKICEKLETKTSMAYKLVRGITPRPHCPLPAGIYSITNNSTFLLNQVFMLQIEGYMWRMRHMFHEKKGQKRVRPLACVELDVIINRKRA